MSVLLAVQGVLSGHKRLDFWKNIKPQDIIFLLKLLTISD